MYVCVCVCVDGRRCCGHLAAAAAAPSGDAVVVLESTKTTLSLRRALVSRPTASHVSHAHSTASRRWAAVAAPHAASWADPVNRITSKPTARTSPRARRRTRVVDVASDPTSPDFTIDAACRAAARYRHSNGSTVNLIITIWLAAWRSGSAVSYTHLTLPTILRV